jgi:uncharacterized damage-inducible protein DinB
MYRKTEDFLKEWEHESKSTVKMLHTIPDAAMNKTIHNDVRKIGRLSWHITMTLSEMLRTAGLKNVKGPEEHAPVPATMKEIIDTYQSSSDSLKKEVEKHWTDGYLTEQVPMYGETWRIGTVLSVLIRHQAHHRGQLSVLMRSEGLKPVGVYGPTKEEWALMNMPAME